MCVRYLRCVLLVWFPAVLHAQSAAHQPCRAPRLTAGYFDPEQETYPHGNTITYACDNGRKPAVEGWWARSTCQNGKWSHEPRCIDENDCIPPTIPNAKYTENSNGWYEEGHTIRITCDRGYEFRDHDATAVCMNGTWTSVPVCERSDRTCDEPPKIPHAVIIHREYQELFAADSEVQYECEDGFTVEGAHTKSIFCVYGNWTEGPTCIRETRPGPGHGGSSGSGRQPTGGDRETRPGTGHGGSAGGHTTSTGSGTRPVGGGSSTTSGSNERDTQTISHCGRHPIVTNGVIVEAHQWFLKYQCNTFYKRVGPQRVVCYSDGTWSEVPVCQVAYCNVNTDHHPHLIPVGVKFIRDGEKVILECVKLDHWWLDHYSEGRCTNGKISFTRCCHWWQLKTNC